MPLKTAVQPKRAAQSLCRSILGELATRLPGFLTLGRFLVVGAVGYLVYQLVVFATYDWSLLWFLPAKGTSFRLAFFRHEDVRLLIATLVAAELSIIGAFTAHTRWTFRNRELAYKPLWLRFAQFNAKALVSTAGIMTATVNVLILRFNFYHYIAVPFGVLAGFTWNWLWDAQFIFRRAKSRQEAG